MGRFIDAWRLLNAPCRTMARLASEGIDRPLGRVERVALRSHLVYCSACRRYARQVRALGRALRGDPDRVAPGPGLEAGPRLPDDVRERIKRRLRGD